MWFTRGVQVHMKVESVPSSSSNHVVLQRLANSKMERRGEDGELPRIGEDDIDNVIGSCKTATAI